MSFRIAEEAIEAKLLAEWTRPLIPIVFSLRDQTKPLPSTGAWVYVLIQAEVESLTAFGGGEGRNEWEVAGRIEGRFFVPNGGPVALARLMRDEFSTIFRGKKFSNVRCLSATPGMGNASETSGNFFMLDATVDFVYRFRG